MGGGSWLRESRARGDLDSGASEAPCRSARPQTPPSWPRCTGRSTGRALTLRRDRQADVLFGIALALLSSRTSFSSSLIRCASSVVVPGRVPWSIWAFLTQVRRASGWTPSSRRSCGSRPWPAPGQPASPTPVLVARSRSSSGYLVCPMTVILTSHHCPHQTQGGSLSVMSQARPTARSSTSTTPWPTAGPTPATTPPRPNAARPYPHGCTSTITTDPTPPATTSHQPPASQHTSPTS